MPADLRRLELRVIALEQRLRSLSAVALMLVAFVALTVVTVNDAFSAPTILKARGLQIVDARGRPRLELIVSNGGEPRVRLMDSRGIRRLDLDIDGDEPGLAMFDALRQVRVSLGIDRSGIPVLNLYDHGGSTATAIVLAQGHLSVYDKDSNELFRAGSDIGRDAGIGDWRMGIWIADRKNQKTIWSAP